MYLKSLYIIRLFKLCFSITILLYSETCFGQSVIKDYVRTHTHKVNTISPDSTNYADLDSLGEAIGNARIVMLGEQDHGDAPTFLAKTRIIKYLHEKKGFDVLAFESDFFGLNEGWDKLPKDEQSIDTFLKKNIFVIWTWCDACQDLFYKYIPSTFASSFPLNVSGFDPQLFFSYARKSLYKQLDSVLKKQNIYIPIPHDSLGRIKYSYSKKTTDDSVSHWLKTLQLIKIELSDKLSENNFWVKVVTDVIYLERKSLLLDNKKASFEELNASVNYRDSLMADNLKYLLNNKYMNHKIVVWAHNYHISKYGGHYPISYYNLHKSMGTIFTSDSLLLHSTYILGFTSYKGRGGTLYSRKYRVKKQSKANFESWIDKNDSFAFVNFNKYNKLNPQNYETFWMHGSIFRPHSRQKAEWNKIFDGVFFIRDMYPCKLVR